MQNIAEETKNVMRSNAVSANNINDILAPQSSLISKNIVVAGKRTSVRLEPEMWKSLREISRREKCSVNDVCTLISLCKKDLSSLTASIRVFLMLYYKAASTEDGHKRAGHGNIYQMKSRIQQIQRLNGKAN